MKQVFLSIGLVACLAVPLGAQDISVLDRWTADRTTVFSADDIVLDDLLWKARALVIFADSENDPQFQRQMALLSDRTDALAERDVIIITDTNPGTPSALRTALRPRGFMLALVGKDGRTALRKPAPYDVRELSRSIDKMPLRQQEINDRRILD